jgi:hypothetical protein
MFKRSLAAAIAAVALLVPAHGASAGDDATRLRVFLTDGTSLVSYGEPARVGDRVIFSIPIATTANPPLRLVDLPAARVDWDRTNRYAASARASHYVETQAEADYLALSNEIVQALNDVAQASEPARRLAIVERARKTLADWPSNHYSYRQAEVRQMVLMLDDAISDLRAATGPSRFDLSLAAFLDPPLIPEPLLPPPTVKESIEQMLTAARLVDAPAERESLLVIAIAAIDRDRDVLPADWASATRADTEATLHAESRLDRTYRSLTARTMASANRQARLVDVRGLERLLRSIPQRDAALGAKRPDAVNSLIEAVQAKLDVARQAQLARDRWALRAPEYTKYRLAIRTPLDLFGKLTPSLEDIKALSGSSPGALTATQQTASRIVRLTSAITPPDDLAAAHALLISAMQMAGTAAQIRREAALAGDMTRAWNASSAAAGALMLGAKARDDLQALMRPPQVK